MRSSAGSLSVRRLTGSLVLGQQEPQMRIPAPKSKESKCEADPPFTVPNPLLVKDYRLQSFGTMLPISWGLLPEVLARCSGVSSEAYPCDQRSEQNLLRRDILESRLVVHVFRELRRKQLKIDKGRGGGSATVSLAQLKRSFASLSNYEITSRLRDRCECHPLPVRQSTLPSLLFQSSRAASSHASGIRSRSMMCDAFAPWTHLTSLLDDIAG